MSTPIQILFAVVLVFALLAQGCVGRLAAAPPGGGQATLAQADACCPGDHGLEQTSSAGEKVAAFFLVGLLVTAVVAIDILLLAATHDDPFPCCRAVVSICD